MTRARAEYLSAPLVTVDDELEREFEARIADCSTLAYRVAFSVLRQQQDAEDVAQEAFVRAHRSFRKLRNRDAFRAWLVRTTWRLALDHRRGEQRRSARHNAHAIAAIDVPADAVAAAERAVALWQAIDALPEKLRIAIILSGIEGHDIAEVARLLDVPEGTVKSRLFHARKQLQERLQWIR
ncbi:MAG TPA: RNA polymerase sigma factor [Vicinamibacterales bacterium]|nr:RNA polymerase sigma factor [Vicinamibacterales bacterium]